MSFSASRRGLAVLLGCALALPALAHRGPHKEHAAAASAAAAVAAGDATVAIDNFTFDPPMLTVAAGTRVVWTNRDDIPHTIHGDQDSRELRSEVLDTEDHFAFTFARPGTYRYFCSLHPHMQGTVVVQ
ncbi:cupredoxin domain-containing protein [Falsiroseomonas sp. HW251]|uniref:cupredoxin domain-containing protein n=1 Tax=Falsiroseomonas sp. HW251 TaxID=3390998 RepID=UPI003D317090